MTNLQILHNFFFKQILGMGWAEIIAYRQQFYLNNYDVRIICEKNEPPKSVAEKVVRKWNSLESNKCFISTRSSVPSREKNMSFFDVVIQGLACDGGLYVPKGGIPFFTLGIYISEWFLDILI